MNVLLVDDEADVLETMELALSGQGWHITGVTSGESAVRLAEQSSFDVVVTDMRMPGMSGLETIVALKRVNPALAIAVASGYLTTDEERECRELGAFDCLRKPFGVAALVAMIQRGACLHHA
jgi:CheY-like chemotaxis protein